MNTPAVTSPRTYAAILLTTLLAAATARAEDPAATASQAPAWQTPGYVMEEVVVTARAPAASNTPAWQESELVMEEVVAAAAVGLEMPAWQAPGYVMEEVVVTAKRPAAETIPLRLLLTLHERHARRRTELDAGRAADGRLL